MPRPRVPLGLALNLWERMTTWDETVEIARLADALGYDVLVLPESFGRDGFVLCDRLLAATERVRVCLGIANVFSRSPAVLAAAAATLDEASGGRFVLGLGASTPNLVEGWHGLRFERPGRRMRETVDLCRRAWRRDKTPYEGEIFRTGGVRLAFEPLRERIPIWMGALLPRSIARAGALADGWMPTLLPEQCIGAGREALARGASRSGRDAKEVTVAPTFQLVVDDDPERALRLVKLGIALYYGPAESPYARAAAALGYADDVAAVSAAYAEGGSGAAAAAASDRLARAMSVVGPLAQCRERVRALLDTGADVVVLGMPAPTRAACEPLLEGVLPE